MSHIVRTLTLLATISLALVAACNEGEEGPAPTTTPPEATATVGAIASPISSPIVSISTPEDLGEVAFGHGPVEEPGSATAAAAPLLIDLQAAESEGYDRLLFQFEGGLPGYRVEYVSAPATGCASGLPVEVAGQALLQVSLSPAAAHDEAGVATLDQTELSPALPAVLELEQTCDFEGQVVWVLGLTSEVDFRVFSLADALLVVDVQHP